MEHNSKKKNLVSFFERFDETKSPNETHLNPVSGLKTDNKTNAINMVQYFERQALNESNNAFSIRPQLEKIGALNVQLPPSYSSVRTDMKKIAHDSDIVAKKMDSCRKHTAEWLNSFNSPEISEFAIEFEKFFQMHCEINRKLSKNLNYLASSLKCFNEVESKRNKDLTAFVKDVRMRNDLIKRGTNNLRNLDYNIDRSKTALVVTQFNYEKEIRINLRRSMFSYVNEVASLGLQINTLTKDTKLDLNEFDQYENAKQYKLSNLSNSSIISDKSTSSLSLIKTKFSKHKKNEADTLIQKYDTSLEGISPLSNDQSINSSDLSDIEQDEEEKINTILRSYDKGVHIDHNIPKFNNNFARNQREFNNDFESTLKHAKFTQRDIPNDTNMFESGDNYATINGKNRIINKFNYYGNIQNDSSEVWK